MPSSKLSICAIIPTYNRSDLIGETLDSVLGQTRRADEIIVVDDGSTDNTAEVVSEYGDQVRLISKENGGKSSALNMALAETQADAIWICDDDDIADPKALEWLAGALEANPDADMVFGDHDVFRVVDGQAVYDGYKAWRRAGEDNVKINFLEDMFALQFAMLVRRSAYERVGAFNEDLVRSQDYEMTLRLTREGQCEYVPHCIFYQRQHDGARGSKAYLVAAEQMNEAWLRYDQMIFGRIYTEYALEEFTPSFALEWGKDRQGRAALIERACVMAKCGLWDKAIDDLETVISSSSEALSAEEHALAEVVVREKLAWKALAEEPEHAKRLADLYRKNAFGREVVFALVRPALWHARLALTAGDVKDASAFMGLLVRTLGVLGALRRLWFSVMKVKR